MAPPPPRKHRTLAQHPLLLMAMLTLGEHKYKILEQLQPFETLQPIGCDHHRPFDWRPLFCPQCISHILVAMVGLVFKAWMQVTKLRVAGKARSSCKKAHHLMRSDLANWALFLERRTLEAEAGDDSSYYFQALRVVHQAMEVWQPGALLDPATSKMSESWTQKMHGLSEHQTVKFQPRTLKVDEWNARPTRQFSRRSKQYVAGQYACTHSEGWADTSWCFDVEASLALCKMYILNPHTDTSEFIVPYGVRLGAIGTKNDYATVMLEAAIDRVHRALSKVKSPKEREADEKDVSKCDIILFRPKLERNSDAIDDMAITLLDSGNLRLSSDYDMSILHHNVDLFKRRV